jgi:hypothetical protein
MSNNQTHQRKTVNRNLFHDYTWLGCDENENTILHFCKLCRNRNGNTKLALGTTDLSLKEIKRHLETNEHEMSELQLQSELNEKQLTIISLMRSVYFLSKKNLSSNIYSDLCELITLQFENNNHLVISEKTSTLKPATLKKNSTPRSTHGGYTNFKAASDFLDSIASVIKESLFEELNSSIYWSIMIDEANSIDNSKYLAIVGKYIVNNIPYMRYLGMINLESTTAGNIYNQILSFCTSNEISYHKIIHFGSDGASNMTGNQTGVATRLKEINPFMTSIHCISHRLHLAGKDASDEVEYFQQYEKVLRSLYSYFSRSHKRQDLLKLMQEINDEPTLKVLNLCDTRWLSLSSSVYNLHQIMNSVIAALNDDMLEGDGHARVLLEKLDCDFISVTMFLADLTNILKRLIKIFQSDNLSLSQYKPNIDATIKEITAEFIGDGEISPNYGMIFKNYLVQNHYFSVPSFVKDYSLAMIKAINNRFPDTELFSSFKIFDPNELPDIEDDLNLYGQSEIEFLDKFYGDTRLVNDAFCEIVEKGQLIEEWNSLKFYLQSCKNIEMNFIEIWKDIFDTDNDFSFNYPNLTIIIKIALLIPFSNAHVERIFSEMKLIKNKLRNKMDINTLNNHLMILLNGPDVRDFDFEKAYKHWANKKRRNSCY